GQVVRDLAVESRSNAAATAEELAHGVLVHRQRGGERGVVDAEGAVAVRGDADARQGVVERRTGVDDAVESLVGAALDIRQQATAHQCAGRLRGRVIAAQRLE